MLSHLFAPGLSSVLAYTPFVYPLPIWDYWPWLILPLTLGV